MPRLTLVVPGLLGPHSDRLRFDVGAEHRFRAIAILLARAARVDDSVCYETLLCRLFGVEEETEYDLPVAAITHLADFISEHDGGWMRADPVHLQPDLGKLLLFDGRSFSLRMDEARQLVRELNAALVSHAIEIKVGRDPKRWYVRLEEAAAFKTWPPSAVAMRRLEGFLPKGADAIRWVRLMNEVQMVLHDTQVNREREDRGEPAINSLWFWGAGSLPPVAAFPGRAVWGSDPIVTGLAVLGGCTPSGLPRSLEALLKQAGPATECLVVFPEEPSVQNHQAWLERLDRDWFHPLLARLRLGRLRRVDLYTEGCHFEISVKSLWRLWRRPGPIAP
ncbi:MAG: hypothetical protein ACREVH_01090 [Gammaproteobacteria bacterium]